MSSEGKLRMGWVQPPGYLLFTVLYLVPDSPSAGVKCHSHTSQVTGGGTSAHGSGDCWLLQPGCGTGWVLGMVPQVPAKNITLAGIAMATMLQDVKLSLQSTRIHKHCCLPTLCREVDVCFLIQSGSCIKSLRIYILCLGNKKKSPKWK